MELRDLRYFLAVAEIGQIHRAAERVGRSQPAISKSIRRLEIEIGAQLFEKQGRGIRMTSVGEALFAKARMICRVVDESTRDVRDAASGSAGHIRIGVGPTTAVSILPDLLAVHLKQYPKLTLDILSEMGDVLRRRLRDGELDLVIAPLAEADTEFVSIPILDDNLVVVGRKGHRLSGRKVYIDELKSQHWVLPIQSLAATNWLNQAFVRHKLPVPKIQISTNGVIVLYRVVAKSDLLAFISRSDIRLDRTGALLEEIQVRELVMHRKLGLLYAKDRYLPPAAKRLIDLVQSGTLFKKAKKFPREAS